jgi:hypothetical protein
MHVKFCKGNVLNNISKKDDRKLSGLTSRWISGEKLRKVGIQCH